MALKFIIFSAILALAQAGVLTPLTYLHKTASYPQVDAVASTHESVVRSFDGTVSHHSKAVDTPFSSVRKTDTRVNNNVYTPALAKTVTYAAPLTNTVYSHASPAVLHKTLYTPTAAAPVVYSAPSHVQYEKYPSADLYTHASPTVTKTISYAAQAPAAHVYHHDVPNTASTTYHHGPAAATYSHNDPAVTAYGSSQTVHYSPANMVSHMSFDGFGTHWGF